LEFGMKGIVTCLVLAVALAVFGALCLGASRLDRERARAQESFLTGDYDSADSSLNVVERYYEYASRLPWVGDGPVSAVRTRRAAVKYWQRKYSALAPTDVADPLADAGVSNLPLQVVVADSVYRISQAGAKDRAAMVKALDGAIDAYHTVLRNARRPDDAPYAEEAAYNYEYVVRLRNEIANGRRRALPSTRDESEFGSEGKPEDPTFENQFKQYIPLEKDERQDDNPGKISPPVRKG
jgi:hypothetical protein